MNLILRLFIFLFAFVFSMSAAISCCYAVEEEKNLVTNNERTNTVFTGYPIVVVGDTDSFSPLSHTSYMSGHQPFLFTKQQDNDALLLVLGNRQIEKTVGNKLEAKSENLKKRLPVEELIVFANSDFNDLIADMARTEVMSNDHESVINSQKPGFIKLDNISQRDCEIAEGGNYRIWVKGDGGLMKQIEAIAIGDKIFPIEKQRSVEIAEELPKFWNIGGDPFFVKKEDAVAYKNKASLKLYGNTPSPYANLALPVQPEYVATLNGKTLKFTSYIKAKRAGIANLQMGITYADDTYSEIVSEFHPGDDQWHEISLSKKFEKPVKNLTLNIFNRGTAEDYIYIDNAFCELNGKAVGKLIPNGDFEEWVEGSRYFTQKKALAGWFKLGSMELEKGRYKIAVNGREKPIAGQIEMLIISEGKEKEYEDLLSSKRISYLFYPKENVPPESNAVKMNDAKGFYIPETGEYEITALIRPESGNMRAFALDEWFNNLEQWNIRIGDNQQRPARYYKPRVGGWQRAEGKEIPEDIMPTFIFGENFNSPQTLYYPLSDGLWRWMSNEGKILVFNPVNAAMEANVSLSIASFAYERVVEIFSNGIQLKTLTLPGVEEKLEKDVLNEISEVEQLSIATGKPQKIELRGIILKPGINELLLKSSPSATIIGKNDKFSVSIAINDNFTVKFSKTLPIVASWQNIAAFNARITNEGLIFDDDYRVNERGVSWVTRYLDKIDIHSYPLFILNYSWFDNRFQEMEVGFRVDTDGDGREDIYFVRSLSSNSNNSEIDILEELWKTFSDKFISKAFLVGVDFFPHKKWGADVSKIAEKGVSNYLIKGMQIASKEALMAIKSDSFRGISFSNKSSYYLSQDNENLAISIPLGRGKETYRSAEFRVPIRRELLEKSPNIIIPFRVSNEGSQNISVWVGYNTSGDGKADEFVPLGRKAQLSKGKTFKSIIVLKNDKPLIPTWNNEFRITKEQVQAGEGKVIINLPRDQMPEYSKYELYYMPDDWVRDSYEFPGFKEYVFNIKELRKVLSDNVNEPVELKFVLEEMAVGDIDRKKDHNFYFKAPVYTYMVPPKFGHESLKNSAPVILLDNKAVEFDSQKVDKEKDGIWFTTKLLIKKGERYISINKKGRVEVRLVEIKPASDQQSQMNSHKPTKIRVKKVNPTRYVVEVKDMAKWPFTLVLSESFHKGWRAYVRQKTDGKRQEEAEPWSALWSAWKDRGNRIEIKDHFVVNGYANGWIVNSEQLSVNNQQLFEIVMEYKTQQLFELGLILSITTLLGCALYIISILYKKRKAMRS